MPGPRSLSVALLLALAAPAAAGLHYSGETWAELPSRWQGLLLDHRALRQIAAPGTPESPESALRVRYKQEAAKLAALAKSRKLTPDEAADLGALHVRLGDSGAALEVLRPAQRAAPVHFRLAANLGAAWHLHGDLAQAAAALEQAVKLAPGKFAKAEELHLKLVRLRAREKAGANALDDLFGARWVGPSGEYEPGAPAEGDRKRLSATTVARAQQLALWLPGDARLLWQLAELASASGDVRTAAAIMDGCVTEFGLRDPELAKRRKLTRKAADAEAKPGKKEHEEHALTLKPRSSRPLLAKGAGELPPVDRKAVNALAWEVITETTVDRQARPAFPKYLRELDGLKVRLSGYLQPLGEDAGLSAFLLIEHPVGCWYCEMPELTGMVLVELPEGRAAQFTRERITVTGELKLNATDPENFLYLVKDATIRE